MTLELPAFASVMAPTTLNYKDLLRICLSPEAELREHRDQGCNTDTIYTSPRSPRIPFTQSPAPIPWLQVSRHVTLWGRIPFGCQNYFVHK